MLLKTAVVKESVDQMELVNVTLVFTWRIVQVSLRYGIFFEYYAPSYLLLPLYYGNGAPAMSTSWYYPKLKGKHC